MGPPPGLAEVNDHSAQSSQLNYETSEDILVKKGVDLNSLDYDETSENPNADSSRDLASQDQGATDSIAPMLLASVEQANMLEPAAPIVDMGTGMSTRVRPRFGVMIVGAIFTKNLEIKEGAIEALRELQRSCETEDDMVLILEDTKNPPDLTQLESELGYDEGKIWNIIRSCRGVELLSLMSSGSGDGAFDYLIGNGKVHRFEIERCFNLKSHYKMDDAWITKEDGLYVGNWSVCLRWIQEKRTLPLTIAINIEAWPVDEACAKMIKGWTGERLLAVLGRGPILTGSVEGIIISRSRAIPHQITSVISVNAKPWFRDAMTNWMRRKQMCPHEGFSMKAHPETDLAKIITLHAFIRGWDCRQPSGPMCKERTLYGRCQRIPCAVCNKDTICKASKAFEGASVREIQKTLQPGSATGPRGEIQDMAIKAGQFALEGQAAVFMQEWSSFTEKGSALVRAAENALRYRAANVGMAGEVIMQNVKIFRYTGAESANGLDMCLMVGGSDSAVDPERSTKCAQAANNLPCISTPCSVCRTYLKFTMVLRYIGEQKDRPAIWQASPMPDPLTLGQFLVQTGWGVLKVCLLEQTVHLLDCSLKLTEDATARDILSNWAGMVYEDQNECGYLTLGEKVLALADMNGFKAGMTEDDLGIFVNDIVDPPVGRT